MTFLSVYEALAKDQREKVWIKISISTLLSENDRHAQNPKDDDN